MSPFHRVLGNVGMPSKILIPPCSYALLGLPAQEALFRWFAVTVIQAVTLLSLSIGTCSRDTTFRLVALSAFIPASPIGRVGENTSPYLSPLRTGLDSYPIIRLKPLALQNVCLCVRVCDTLYVGGLNYRFCLCHRLSPLFCDGCAVPLH